MTAIEFIQAGLPGLTAKDLHRLRHAITDQLQQGMRREVVQLLRDNHYKQAKVLVRDRMQWSNEKSKEYVDTIKARYEKK